MCNLSLTIHQAVDKRNVDAKELDNRFEDKKSPRPEQSPLKDILPTVAGKPLSGRNDKEEKGKLTVGRHHQKSCGLLSTRLSPDPCPFVSEQLCSLTRQVQRLKYLVSVKSIDGGTGNILS